MSENGILAQIPGQYVSRALNTLPDAGRENGDVFLDGEKAVAIQK